MKIPIIFKSQAFYSVITNEVYFQHRAIVKNWLMKQSSKEFSMFWRSGVKNSSAFSFKSRLRSFHTLHFTFLKIETRTIRVTTLQCHHQTQDITNSSLVGNMSNPSMIYLHTLLHVVISCCLKIMYEYCRIYTRCLWILWKKFRILFHKSKEM